MADRRIKDIATTASSPDPSDYVALDSSGNGTRKVLWSSMDPLEGSGAIYLTSSAATTISDTATFFKAAGTTAQNNTESSLANFDDGGGVSNRLRYTGTPTVKALIVCNVSASAASNNQTLDFRIYKYDASAGSGATLVHTDVERKTGTGGDVGSVSIAGDCMLDTNDYLEIWVKNSTSTSSVTLTHCYLRAAAVK